MSDDAVRLSERILEEIDHCVGGGPYRYAEIAPDLARLLVELIDARIEENARIEAELDAEDAEQGGIK